jgi:hypothetical protein
MQEVTGSTPVFSTFIRRSFSEGGKILSKVCVMRAFLFYAIENNTIRSFMKYSSISLLTFIFFACSTSNKKDNKQVQEKTAEIKTNPPTNDAPDTKWLTYTDTINMGFVVSYKYSKNYVSEHMENAECIGKPIKDVDAWPRNTMNCSMWMDDVAEGNVRPIDTLIQYAVDQLKESVQQSRDTIIIADVKGLRVLFTRENDKREILKQEIFFTKYNTFFELINDSLPEQDFQVFINSLKIEKTN